MYMFRYKTIYHVVHVLGQHIYNETIVRHISHCHRQSSFHIRVHGKRSKVDSLYHSQQPQAHTQFSVSTVLATIL